MANFFKKNKPHKKKQSWEREDRTLDYVASHKAEITRYLVVVLISELWKWVLYNIIYSLSPVFGTFESGFTFLFWAVPYFFACKLWVWKQKGDDGYVWGIQGMKFIMAILIIALINVGVHFILELMMLGASLTVSISHLVEEILYFIALYYFILKPHKN